MNRRFKVLYMGEMVATFPNINKAYEYIDSHKTTELLNFSIIDQIRNIYFLINEYIPANLNINPKLVPLKRKAKEKYWNIGLFDNNENIFKTLVQPFRTKTLAKEFARSVIGKTLNGKIIYAVSLEGPFNKIIEASKASHTTDETVH